MTVQLVTGFAGKPHISSDDEGAWNAGTIGSDLIVYETGDSLKLTLVDNNHVSLGTGDLSIDGRHVRVSAPEQMTIESGAQGSKRNDLVIMHYEKDATSGVETVKPQILKGTSSSGSAEDPAIADASILGGAAQKNVALWRLPIDGLTVGEPQPLFKVMPPVSSIWDSVTLTDVLSKQIYPDLKVTAQQFGHMVTITVDSGSSLAVTSNGWTDIATLLSSASPVNQTQTIFGTATDGAQGVLAVSGTSVQIGHQGVTGSKQWYIHQTLTYMV